MSLLSKKRKRNACSLIFRTAKMCSQGSGPSFLIRVYSLCFGAADTRTVSYKNALEEFFPRWQPLYILKKWNGKICSERSETALIKQPAFLRVVLTIVRTSCIKMFPTVLISGLPRSLVRICNIDAVSCARKGRRSRRVLAAPLV
jgi:hypothetical protein